MGEQLLGSGLIIEELTKETNGKKTAWELSLSHRGGRMCMKNRRVEGGVNPKTLEGLERRRY